MPKADWQGPVFLLLIVLKTQDCCSLHLDTFFHSYWVGQDFSTVLELGGTICYFCSVVIDQNLLLGSTKPQEDRNFSLRVSQKEKRTSCHWAALGRRFLLASPPLRSHTLWAKALDCFSQARTKSRRCEFPQGPKAT